MARQKCFLCPSMANFGPTNDPRGAEYDCEVCGSFWVSSDFASDHSANLTHPERIALSAATRQSSKRLSLMNSNWRELVEAHSNVPVARKLEKVFEAVRSESSYAGKYVPLDPSQSYPLADASGKDEFDFLVGVLVSEDLIEREGHGLRLTGKGWSKAEALGAASQKVVFVAMPFTDEMTSVFDEAIKPAIEVDCGYTRAVRVDKEKPGSKTEDKIDARIIAEIRRCRFVVADSTGNNANVYFEAGFAFGLGKDVIWTCKDGEIEQAKFDVRQYPHVVWKDPQHLREQLAERIRSCFADAKPAPV